MCECFSLQLGGVQDKCLDSIGQLSFFSFKFFWRNLNPKLTRSVFWERIFSGNYFLYQKGKTNVDLWKKERIFLA